MRQAKTARIFFHSGCSYGLGAALMQVLTSFVAGVKVLYVLGHSADRKLNAAEPTQYALFFTTLARRCVRMLTYQVKYN